jgi:acetyl esterase/lipase
MHSRVHSGRCGHGGGLCWERRHHAVDRDNDSRADAHEARFPAQVLDVKVAIRFLRANASVFDFDANRFAVVGESAGGHPAALLGTTEGVAEFYDPALGNRGVSSEVQAVVDFYGPANLSTSDAQRALSPGCSSDPNPNIALLLGASPAAAP